MCYLTQYIINLIVNFKFKPTLNNINEFPYLFIYSPSNSFIHFFIGYLLFNDDIFLNWVLCKFLMPIKLDNGWYLFQNAR